MSAPGFTKSGPGFLKKKRKVETVPLNGHALGKHWYEKKENVSNVMDVDGRREQLLEYQPDKQRLQSETRAAAGPAKLDLHALISEAEQGDSASTDLRKTALTSPRSDPQDISSGDWSPLIDENSNVEEYDPSAPLIGLKSRIENTLATKRARDETPKFEYSPHYIEHALAGAPYLLKRYTCPRCTRSRFCALHRNIEYRTTSVSLCKHSKMHLKWAVNDAANTNKSWIITFEDYTFQYPNLLPEHEACDPFHPQERKDLLARRMVEDMEDYCTAMAKQEDNEVREVERELKRRTARGPGAYAKRAKLEKREDNYEMLRHVARKAKDSKRSFPQGNEARIRLEIAALLQLCDPTVRMMKSAKMRMDKQREQQAEADKAALNLNAILQSVAEAKEKEKENARKRTFDEVELDYGEALEEAAVPKKAKIEQLQLPTPPRASSSEVEEVPTIIVQTVETPVQEQSKATTPSPSFLSPTPSVSASEDNDKDSLFGEELSYMEDVEVPKNETEAIRAHGFGEETVEVIKETIESEPNSQAQSSPGSDDSNSLFGEEPSETINDTVAPESESKSRATPARSASPSPSPSTSSAPPSIPSAPSSTKSGRKVRFASQVEYQSPSPSPTPSPTHSPIEAQSPIEPPVRSLEQLLRLEATLAMGGREDRERELGYEDLQEEAESGAWEDNGFDEEDDVGYEDMDQGGYGDGDGDGDDYY